MKSIVKAQKGSAQELIEVAIAIMVIGIIMYAWVFAGSELETSAAEYLDDTIAVVNESWNTSTQDVWVTLDHTRIINSSKAVTNATYTCVYTTDYLINITDSTINSVSTGNMLNHTEYNITYNYLRRTAYGNMSDTTGEMGEKGSAMLVIGILLLAIFAAVGFLVYPYIRRAMR